MKVLLLTALLALPVLVACSDPAPTAVVTPPPTSQTELATPAESGSQPTGVAEPTQAPTRATTPLPTEIPTVVPKPTATAAPTPTAMPEPKAMVGLAHEPTRASTQPPTEATTAAPEPNAAVAPAPAIIPEPTATATRTLTPASSPVSASTRAPTTFPTPVVTLPTLVPEPRPPRRTRPSPTATPAATSVDPTSLWRGINVAPEDRCSPYDPDDYPYSPSVEPRIVQDLGGVYGPYTGTWFKSIKETDIEHIVARAEAHDSGLCAADHATRSEFASDLVNLTLASPSVNRHQKVDKDVAEWLPDLNQCWFVGRTVQVRLEYGLTIDQAEADAVDMVLSRCESIEMVVLAPAVSGTPTAPPTPTPASDVDALALWDDNGNGRITCAEARAHGIAPVRRGHPAYPYMRDADGDGIVCE